MKKWNEDSMDLLYEAILSLKNKEECQAFLEDICTIREIQDISQRLEVAMLLDRGESYTSISQQTGASTTTISRVGKCYEYGSDGYTTVLERLKKKNLIKKKAADASAGTTQKKQNQNQK